MPIQTRILRIYERPDCRFEVRNERPGDRALGIHCSLDQAIESAQHAAVSLACEEWCRVSIMVPDNGTWKEIYHADPPARCGSAVTPRYRP
jgi:hypothetical protein